MNLNNYLDSLEKKTEIVFRDFQDFSDGCRMLILLERKKEGGSTKEEKRSLITRFTFNSDQYRDAIKEMLLLQLICPNARLYASLNSRNIKKTIRIMETELLDAHYADDTCRDSVYKKLIRSARHFVMQPTTANESLFLIDVDDEEGKDIMGEALLECGRLNVEILKTYKTKNGWHIITKPFNLGLWTHKSEVKKDPLILLTY